MEAWATFWYWVLVCTLSIFAALTVAVAIGGIFDIRALLKAIDKHHKDPDPSDDPEG